MAMSAFALDAVSGAPSYTGKMLRGALSALLGEPPAGRPLGATSGVRPGTPSATVSVAGSTVTIAPHAGVLDVQADATTGPYLYAVTAAETVALNAAHATYTRWDRISVQLSDPAAGDGTSTPGVAIVYTAGTPSASPAMPAEPARSLTLARIVVPQSGGGSASVVWLAPESVDRPPWYPTTGDRDRAIPNPSPGTIAIIGTGAAMQVVMWDGAAWQTIWPDDTGWQALTVTGFSGGSARWRAIGRRVFWEYHGTGLTSIAAAGIPSGGAVAAAIPVTYRPANPTPLAATSGTLQLGTANMNSNGAVGYRNTSPASVTEVHINGSWVI